MNRPRLLDLFCGAGGAAMGYSRAGFDVIGVDIAPQPRYPFEFVQADALDLLATLTSGDWFRVGRNYRMLADFAAIHASPPCQAYSAASQLASQHARDRHVDLLGPTRDLLVTTGLPWVIENVPGAPMRADLRLCGCMFGLPSLKRERWFETSWRAFDLRQPCDHREPILRVFGSGGVWPSARKSQPRKFTRDDVRAAMGIDWMNPGEMSQAIPPAYTEYIGRQLLDHLTAMTA